MLEKTLHTVLLGPFPVNVHLCMELLPVGLFEQEDHSVMHIQQYITQLMLLGKQQNAADAPKLVGMQWRTSHSCDVWYKSELYDRIVCIARQRLCCCVCMSMPTLYISHSVGFAINSRAPYSYLQDQMPGAHHT